MAKQIINGVHYYPKESDAKEGFAVIPNGENAGIYLVIHGRGELADGLIPNLINLVEGWDYDNDPNTPREYPLATPEWRRLLTKHNYVGVVVNYKTSLTPSDIDYVLDTASKDFGTNGKIAAVAFSQGGAQLIPYVTSSVDRAKRLLVAGLAAPVTPSGNWKNVVDARLQVIGATATGDPIVNANGIRTVINTINALNPTIKPVLIEWQANVHTGLNELLSDESIFEYLNTTSATNRKQYVRPTPGKPVEQPSPGIPDFNIANGQVITTSEFELDASASQGATSYYWKVDRAEAPWTGPNWVGGTVGGPKKKITGLMNGLHTVQLEINGAIKSPVRTFVVRLSGEPEPKKLIEATGSIVLKYSDGSTGTASVKVVDGKLVVE